MKLEKARAKFDDLRAKFLAADEALAEYQRKLELKYHASYIQVLCWAKRGEIGKLEALRKRAGAASDRLFKLIQEISPRDWRSGPPAYWVYRELSFEDVVRPLGEKLSVTPPLAYGCTEPMR